MYVRMYMCVYVRTRVYMYVCIYWIDSIYLDAKWPAMLKQTLSDLICSRVPPAGAHYLASDFSSALTLVDTELAEQADQVWVIGGSSLYKVIIFSVLS